MRDIFVEEIKRITGLKRFRIMCLLLLAGFIAWVIYTKVTFWNDFMYLVRVQNYMLYFFNLGSFVTVMLGLHRRKFTSSSIVLANGHGGSRAKTVLGKWLTGICLIFIMYAVLAVLVILMSLILGAHSSGDQIGVMMLSILMNAISVAGSYGLYLMFQFLTAFPAVSILLATISIEILPAFIDRYGFDLFPELVIINNLLMYGRTRAGFSGILLGMPRFEFLLFFLIYSAVGVLFSMLIFKLKREKKPRKSRKKNPEKEQTPQEDISISTPAV